MVPCEEVLQQTLPQVKHSHVELHASHPSAWQ